MNRDMIVLLDNSENTYFNELAPMNLHSSNKALKPQWQPEGYSIYNILIATHIYRSTQIPSLFAGSLSKELSYPHDIIRTCYFSNQEVQYIKGHT